MSDTPAPTPVAHTGAMKFLLGRRSCPAKTLGAPVPDRAALIPILTAALRCPDHGKLEPWRLVVLEKPALKRIAQLAEPYLEQLPLAPEKAEKARRQFGDADLVVAVISSPVQSDKVPLFEQLLSAGAVALGLLNASLASGWGANWLTGPLASNDAFLHEALGLVAPERLAAFIHIGTPVRTPPERPRPDLEKTVSWLPR